MKRGKSLPPVVPQDGWLSGKLSDPEFSAEYLNATLADGDQAAFMLAMRQVAKARSGGVAALARDTGLNRAALSRAMSETGNPELRSLNAVLAAAGLTLAVRPMAHSKGRRQHAKSAD